MSLIEKKQHSIKVPKLYKEAAKILKEIKTNGGSFKNLIYSAKYPNLKTIYALVINTLHHADYLQNLIDDCKILQNEKQLDPWLAQILIAELILRKKTLPGKSKPIQTVLSYKSSLIKCSENIANEIKEQKVRNPRYVRINTIFLSVENAIKMFENEGWCLLKKRKKYSSFLKQVCDLENYNFCQDFHLEEVLVFPAGTDFSQNELYSNGSLILQDKASCLASHLLNPEEGSSVLDLCAAPGMKTTHLAAIMKNTGNVYAVEMHKNRYNLLCETIAVCGAKSVQAINADALNLDKKKFSNVKYILVDPTCSGSGNEDRLLINEQIDDHRFKKLVGFQINILRYVLTEFPAAQRIVYSTCSLSSEENEEVIQKAMAYAEKNGDNQFQVVNKLPKAWKNKGSASYPFGSNCLYAIPNKDYTVGFFIAVLERCNNNLNSKQKLSTGNKSSKQKHLPTNSENSDIIGKFIKKKKRKHL